MKILVMGGSYFIGWHLVKRLAKEGHKVWVFNRGTKQRDYPRNVHSIIGDRNDVPRMLESLNKFKYDVVFDISASKGEHTEVMIRNFKGKISRYFHISTAAVYLQSEIFPIKEEFPVGKHHVWGVYGGNKLDCENLLLDAHRHLRFPVTIFRPSYVYGPENYIARERFLYERLIKSRDILIPGDGNALIQLGHVFDLTDAWIAALSNSKSVGQIYNVSGEEYITLNGLVQLAGKILQKNPQIVHVDPLKFGLTARDIFPFDNVTYFTDINKAKHDLAFTPHYSLQAGLEEGFKLLSQSIGEFKPADFTKEDTVLSQTRTH